jgi:cytochrome P450 family 142 subfamily A polypeptide 1
VSAVPTKATELTARPTVDLLDPEFHVGDPHPAYTWMRHHEPMYRDVNGIWCITRMDHLREIERRAADFVSSKGYRSVWFPEETSMISQGDPGHRDQRAVISDLFTRRAVAELDGTVRKMVVDALAEVDDGASFEVVDTIAARLPAEVTCHLLGWSSEHWPEVRSWSERLMRVDSLHRDPALMADAIGATTEIAALTAPTIEERRGRPRHDVLSRWANPPAGCPMSLRDVNSELGLVIPGGAETTRTTLARSLIMFSERNDLWESLAADPDLIPRAVEELLRWVTPLNNMFRTVAHDTGLDGVTVDGVTFTAGDRIALVYPSANRDDAWFADPFEIDLTRDPNHHVAFGFGPHLCLGAHVARLTMRVALEEMTLRYTDLRPVAPPVYEANVFVKAVERFELGFARR